MKDNELMKLVQKVANGEELDASREALYSEYYKSIMYVCKKYGLEHQDAEDITQETFITAFSKINNLKDGAKFEAWISRIASNKCMDFLKHNKLITMESIDDNDNLMQLPDKGKAVEDVVIDGEVQEIVGKMVDSLPYEQRLTVFMYYYHDMSVNEIAQIFGCSDNTVKSRLNYARKHLSAEAQKLEDNGFKLRVVAALPFLYAIFNGQKTAYAAEFSKVIPELTIKGAQTVSASGKSAIEGQTNQAVEDGQASKSGTAVVNASAKVGMTVGKKIALICGTIGTIAVVAGAAIAISVGKNNDSNINKRRNEDSKSESGLVADNADKEDANVDENNTDNTSNIGEDVEDTDTAQSVNWEYVPADSISLKAVKTKEFFAEDYVKELNDQVNSFTGINLTDDVIAINFYGVNAKDKTDYYNIRTDNMLNLIDKNKSTSKQYAYCTEVDGARPNTKRNYLAYDENVAQPNTTKLLDNNGKEVIPAKYQMINIISDRYVEAIRWEAGEGSISNYAKLKSANEKYVDLSNYHDVIDIYDMETGKMIEGLSNIDSRENSSVSYDVCDSDEGQVLKVSLSDQDWIYRPDGTVTPYDEGAFDNYYNGLKINITHEDVGYYYLEDKQGNVVSDYYMEMKRVGNFYVCEKRVDENGSKQSGIYYGILNKEGKMLVDTILDDVEPMLYCNELMLISYDNKVGFLNQAGKIVGQFYDIGEDIQLSTDYDMIYYNDGDKSKLVCPGGIFDFCSIGNRWFANKDATKDEDGLCTYTIYDYMGNEMLNLKSDESAFFDILGQKNYIIVNLNEKEKFEVYNIE